MAATIRIQYYRSAIGRSWRQKAIVRGLGLTRLNQIVERPDTPGFRGMVLKAPHLLRVVAPDTQRGGRAGAPSPAERQAGGVAQPRPAPRRSMKGKQ